MTSVSVIGAGPAGSYLAYLLAERGFDVSVFEEHPVIGEPVACTGVIAADVISGLLTLPEDVIVNRVEKARIIAPDGNSVEVRLKNNVVVDRAKLDQHLAGMAKKAGAKYYASHRFLSIEKNNGKVAAKIENKNLNGTKTFESDWLIGADGPGSDVARAAGIFGKRHFYAGMQATVKNENDNAIEFFPSEKGIAWKVPESRSSLRTGVAAERNAGSYFDEFMTKAVGKEYASRVTARQAGTIPLYNPKVQTQKGKALLLGDAATMVKATTFGGINQGIIAAAAAAEAIDTGKDYAKLWRARLEKDLWLSLMMRKAMNRFSDEDYNSLVRIFSKEKNRRVLEEFDRDEPRKFAFKLIMQEPKLILLSRKIFF